MKRSLYTRIIREGTVLTNKFEYKLVGNTIMKRNIEQKGYRQWVVVKVVKRNPFYEKLIKGLQQSIDYETAKANGEDPSQYGKSVNASAKIALGIHSPTEVAAFLGKQYAEAFNDGVEYGKDHRMTEEELAEVMAKCKAITDLFFPEAEDDDEEENDNGYQQL